MTYDQCISNISCSPLFNGVKRQDLATLDLSIDNPSEALQRISNVANMQSYLDNVYHINKTIGGIGGYLERRNLYKNFGHFNNASSHPREFHLGVDIWLPAGTPVFAPLDGVVVTSNYIDLVGDYGGVVILKHNVDNFTFFTLYGHLGKSVTSQWTKGDRVSQNTQIASLGDIHENGGWCPHLHFQIIKDMGNMTDDYPGVASFDTLSFYSANCPNPECLLVFG